MERAQEEGGKFFEAIWPELFKKKGIPLSTSGPKYYEQEMELKAILHAKEGEERWIKMIFHSEKLEVYPKQKGKKKQKSRFYNNFVNDAKNVIKAFIDKFFKIEPYKYYAREDFKRYITLAMESWYIDQNINGILKKCSEISGIIYPDIVKNIVPWQYNTESNETIGKYTFPKGYIRPYEGDDNSIKQNLTKEENDIVTKYGLKKLSTYDWGKNNNVSLSSNLIEIEKYISGIEGVTSQNNKRRTIKSLNSELCGVIQAKYDMEKLMPIKTFSDKITEHNINQNSLLKSLDGKNLKKLTVAQENMVKKWQKKKIDSVIGVLMDPYVNKPQEGSEINIEDYKMFYILANNSTQLKCWDQLKTFNMFANFITKIPK